MGKRFWIHKGLRLVLAVAFAVSGLQTLLPARPVAAAGNLTVEVIAGYNLVVDSNVSSPSTYAPRVATVTGKFCNTGADALTGVYGYIGDYNGGVSSTPGAYPSRDSLTDVEFQSGQKWDYLYNTGAYFFRHVGGASDAARYIGTLEPGECRYQYWTLEYPACENTGGAWANPPCTGDPTWGSSIKPDDDLSLAFDVWGSGYDASAGATRSDAERWTMTMRSEISAMANKIEPNGNPAGSWFNTQEDTVRVGDVITTNGVLYSLGNIRFGFDNDGDYAPDYNAWLQPISQPDYDPTCFRLIRTSGVLTVTRGGAGPLIMPFRDQLYFTNLPPDNTNVRGEVYYTFLALNGPCNIDLSPYQEVASGFDNEKFNGDYGTGIPPLVSLAPEVTIDKSSAPDTIGAGSTTTYRIPFANNGDADAGLSLSSGYGTAMPLTIVDTVPDGMQLASAATAALDYTPNSGVTIRYSTDSGATWGSTAPVGSTSVWPNARIMIEWKLNDPLPKKTTPTNTSTGYAEFQATVPASYAGASFIENTACVGLGDATPFACATDVLRVTGNNSLSGAVFEDDGPGYDFADEEFDTGEATIAGVTISLYIMVDGEYRLWDTTASDSSGNYSFGSLPDGEYRIDVGSVQVTNPGWTNTTDTSLTVDLDSGHATTDPVVSADNDFGFAPALTLQKTLVGPNPALEDQLVTFRIDLDNLLPGTGTAAPGTCYETFTTYSTSGPRAGGSGTWINPANAFEATEPGTLYASNAFPGNADQLRSNAFSPAMGVGTLETVEVVFLMYLNGALGTDPKTADVATVRLYTEATTPVQLTSRILNNATLNTYTSPTVVAWDVTAARDWSDLSFSGYFMEWQNAKVGAADGATVYMNAMGWRITTAYPCGGDAPNSTIDPLPLTDTFDATQMDFVAANPVESAVNVAGTVGILTWNNLGPLYAGGESSVEVTFRVKDGTAGQTLVNTAAVDEAFFTNGNPTNDATDDASVPVIQTARLGDRVWNDVDGDGVQDAGEVGIPGVTVTLTPQTAVVIDGVTYGPSNPWVTTTGANGAYSFAGLQNATYVVTVNPVSLPGTTFTQTFDRDGTLDHATTVVLNGTDVLDADFGYQIPNTIFGAVWQDFDGDSARETGDDPIAGVTVWLYNFGGTLVGTTTTDATGGYSFSDLVDGGYTVVVDNGSAPLGADWTNTRDPESAPGNHQSNPIAVSGGNLYGSYDFGYHQTGDYSLAGKVYGDWNVSYDWETGEPGFPAIPVTLYSSTGAVIAVTTTLPDGSYSFENLPNGVYTVVVDESALPAQYARTEDPDGARDGRTTVTIAGAPVTDVDFGYRPAGAGSIGDTVYRDMNGDGMQAGTGETGIAGITVWLEIYLNGS